MADALQRGQHFADHGAASVQRFLDAALIFVERRQPRLRRLDLGLDRTQAAGGIDQGLIELATIGADLLDLALERGLGFGRFALRVAGGLELLVVLLERVELLGLVVLRGAAGLSRASCAPSGPASASGNASPSAKRHERGARIAAAEPPKANHFGQVTPAGWHGKDIVGGGYCRRLRPNRDPGD